MSDEVAFISLRYLAKHIGRTVGQVSKDARAGLLTLTRKAGIRGPIISLDRANRYIRTKHAGRVSTITIESLNPHE